MFSNKKMIYYMIMAVVGLILVFLGCLELLDSFWSGFGGGLAGVGIVRLFGFARYRNDEDYARKKDIQQNDERNHFIANQAKLWCFYLTIIGLGIAVIVFRVLGNESYSYLCAMIECLILVVYWIAYLILRNKY